MLMHRVIFKVHKCVCSDTESLFSRYFGILFKSFGIFPSSEQLASHPACAKAKESSLFVGHVPPPLLL